MDLGQLVACILGPRLFRINRNGSIPGRRYSGTAAEYIGDNAIKLVYLTWSLSLYASPIIVTYFYQRGAFGNGMSNPGPMGTLFRAAAALLTVLGGGYILRGFGRMTNNEYLAFLGSYSQIQALSTDQIRAKKEELLSQFDFDFAAWPVEYRWSESALADPKQPPMPISGPVSNNTKSLMSTIKMLPCDAIAYIAVVTFGRRMMYPGSVYLLQRAVDPMLLEGRTRLLEKHSAERFKLETSDLNHIDSVFVDRRRSSYDNGRKLVICCEGNAGFYEIGIMATPLEAGYSVMGWNHPGFASSTGLPFPAAEVAAMDTVLKFAIERLGFKPKDIIVYAWSIGGYPCSWGAAHYPELKGVVLDATFDDVVPLAVAKMPASWRPIVVHTVKSYFNLNISENLSHFNGPVMLVRRLQDEIIHTLESDPIRTNRANNILTKLLSQRFPNLMKEEDPRWALQDWLSGNGEHKSRVMQQYQVSGDLCLVTLASYIEANGAHYPVDIGPELSDEAKVQLVLYLASKHLIDYDSTHCTPLPKQLFIEPFNLFEAAAMSPGGQRSNL